MEKRILITGAAGYIGTLLGEYLAGNHFVIGTDIRPDDGGLFPILEQDIRDPALADTLREYRITHIVHLASILDTTADPELAYSIDIDGTHNLVECALAAGVRHLTITSSGAAYGYHPDNPRWIDEETPLRGNDEFPYARHKRIIEELLAGYRARYPALQQLVLRPGTVLGASTGNLITELFERRHLLAIRGSDSPFVFIWDQDLVRVMAKGIAEDRTGIYNLAGDGALTITEIGEILGKPVLRIPASVLRAILRMARILRVGRYGPEQVKFLQYRPVLSNRRLHEEFGYSPQKTSYEAFLYYLEYARASGQYPTLDR